MRRFIRIDRGVLDDDFAAERRMRGFIYAVTRAMADFLSLAKAWELAHAKPRLHPPMPLQVEPGKPASV